MRFQPGSRKLYIYIQIGTDMVLGMYLHLRFVIDVIFKKYSLNFAPLFGVKKIIFQLQFYIGKIIFNV